MYIREICCREVPEEEQVPQFLPAGSQLPMDTGWVNRPERFRASLRMNEPGIPKKQTKTKPTQQTDPIKPTRPSKFCSWFASNAEARSAEADPSAEGRGTTRGQGFVILFYRFTHEFSMVLDRFYLGLEMFCFLLVLRGFKWFFWCLFMVFDRVFQWFFMVNALIRGDNCHSTRWLSPWTKLDVALHKVILFPSTSRSFKKLFEEWLASSRFPCSLNWLEREPCQTIWFASWKGYGSKAQLYLSEHPVQPSTIDQQPFWWPCHPS